MADLYRLWLAAAAQNAANTNLLTGNVKITLVNTAGAGTLYTPNIGVDQFLSAIPAGARVATSANLASKSITGRIFDAADITIPGVSGAEFEAIVGFIDTGVASTSRLAWLMDAATGLPFTPSGGGITTTWNASGIFQF